MLRGRATVIGSGFIGCEAAASLAMKGLEVTLVTDEDVPHEARLGEAAGRRIAGWLRAVARGGGGSAAVIRAGVVGRPTP
jgi:NADPH-dependent 2,4-dienoyl-CoA reductase/sulfur reductase-like enzyme